MPHVLLLSLLCATPREQQVCGLCRARTDCCSILLLYRAHGGTETDVSLKTAASSPSDSLRHADAAPAQPSASSAPEQPAAASAEHRSAAEAEAPPSPVCLCMHEDGATKVLSPLERYRHALSRHPCCSCGRYCKPLDGQQHNPDILAALATMKKVSLPLNF